MLSVHKQNKSIYLVALLIVFLTSFSAYGLRQEKQLLKKVRAGEVALLCQLKQGLIQVRPDKVKNYISGTWYFTNGQSTNCKANQKN